MDVFKFNNPEHPLKMEHGEIINGIDSKMWIERWQTPGEFTFKGKLSKGLREALPVGTFVSHVDSHQVAVVEDHEIIQDKGKSPVITITGRTFDSFLENRIPGTNWVGGSTNLGYVRGHLSNTNTPDDVIRNFIRSYIIVPWYADDKLLWFDVSTDANIMGAGPTIPMATRQGETVLAVVEDLLKAHDLGLRCERPPFGRWFRNSFEPDEYTAYIVYEARDLSSTVVFSHRAGEVESAQYFESSRGLKTGAFVEAKWLQSRHVLGGVVGHERRFTRVNASHLDDDYTTIPVDPARSEFFADMAQLGADAIHRASGVSISNVELSKKGLKYKYRDDYKVGDLVKVDGEYNAVAVMRVIEHVEIEDKTGMKAYPTLVPA